MKKLDKEQEEMLGATLVFLVGVISLACLLRVGYLSGLWWELAFPLAIAILSIRGARKR